MDPIAELYERAPYPPPAQQATLLLSLPWLRGATWPAPVLDGRVLVAGCGTGAECRALQAGLPGAEVVGVDRSAAALEVARAAGLTVARRDLAAGPLGLGRFSLITCHAVADYVEDSEALLRHLAESLARDGLLYLSINTPHHPRDRIRHLQDRLGAEPDRDLLALASSLMGPTAGIEGLARLEAHRLEADIFVPRAHHRSVEQWVTLGEAAGLHLVGCGELMTLATLPDGELGALMGLDRGALGRLVHVMRPRAGATLLFSHAPPPQPFGPQLPRWIPTRDPSLPGDALPPFSAGARHRLALASAGQEEVAVELSAEALAVLGHADGLRSLEELSPQARPVDLFRLWLCDLLHLAPPAT